jgi:predicted double-glycine peptidase
MPGNAYLFAVGVCGLVISTSVQAGVQEGVKSLLEFRHEHVVLQQYDLSCGAAALATVLQFQHEADISEREIALEMLDREEYRDDPEAIQQQAGFSLLDLKRFVDNRGFSGDGYGKLSLEDLQKLAPIVVPVRFDGYDHFVVFLGQLDNRILVADPAWGNRIVDRRKFEASWNHYGDLGHVGFVVRNPDKTMEKHLLLPELHDFVRLR